MAHRPCDSNGKDTSWQHSGNNGCCGNGVDGFCAEGEGDCDEDFECEGDLVCGTDNCHWGGRDDCCESAPTTSTTTTTTTSIATCPSTPDIESGVVIIEEGFVRWVLTSYQKSL